MCGHRHYHHHYGVERRAPAPDRSLRVSDREREEVAAQLRDHAAEGRLTPEELDERVELALSARTGADLDALLVDLPRAPRTAEPPRPHLPAVSLVAGVALLLLAVWLATGAGHFWPVWVLGFLAFAMVRRGRTRWS